MLIKHNKFYKKRTFHKLQYYSIGIDLPIDVEFIMRGMGSLSLMDKAINDVKTELISRFNSFNEKEKEDIILSIKNALASISLDNNKYKDNSLTNIEKQGYELILKELIRLV